MIGLSIRYKQCMWLSYKRSRSEPLFGEGVWVGVGGVFFGGGAVEVGVGGGLGIGGSGVELLSFYWSNTCSMVAAGL